MCLTRRGCGALTASVFRQMQHIYELYESDTGIIRYVGRTHDPKGRLERHRSHIQRCNLAWMAATAARGARCELRVAMSVKGSESDAAVFERQYWEFLLSAGHPLCNASWGPLPAANTDKWADSKWDWSVYDRCYKLATQSVRTAT